VEDTLQIFKTDGLMKVLAMKTWLCFRNLSLTWAWNLPICKWKARASGTRKLSNTAANGKIRQLDTQIETINMIKTT
jgi:hypothetical protein